MFLNHFTDIPQPCGFFAISQEKLETIKRKVRCEYARGDRLMWVCCGVL